MQVQRRLKSIFFVAIVTLITGVINAQSNPLSNKGFKKIFNEENWDGWHLKLRNGDEEMAKEVFAIENGKVHVFKNMPDSLNLGTGKNTTHGLFYTNKKYSKYFFHWFLTVIIVQSLYPFLCLYIYYIHYYKQWLFYFVYRKISS